MQNRILLIRTGGTFDSEPYPDPRNPPKDIKTLKGEDSPVFPTVETLQHHERVDMYRWGAWDEDRFVKDSKYFTEADMKALADIIKNDAHHSFVLTHGTDALVKNAASMEKNLQGTDKVVVFAGAIVPLSMHRRPQSSNVESDGIETLSFALEHMSKLHPGVYVVGIPEGKTRRAFFKPAEVEKNREASLESLKFTLSRR